MPFTSNHNTAFFWYVVASLSVLKARRAMTMEQASGPFLPVTQRRCSCKSPRAALPFAVSTSPLGPQWTEDTKCPPVSTKDQEFFPARTTNFHRGLEQDLPSAEDGPLVFPAPRPRGFCRSLLGSPRPGEVFWLRDEPSSSSL